MKLEIIFNHFQDIVSSPYRKKENPFDYNYFNCAFSLSTELHHFSGFCPFESKVTYQRP